MTDELKPAGLAPLRSPLSFFSTMSLSVEKLRVAVQVRAAHLERAGDADPETLKLYDLLRPVENFIDGHLRRCADEHPTAIWWRRISGLYSTSTQRPLEPLGKLIGEIEHFGRWYAEGNARIPQVVPERFVTAEMKQAFTTEGKRVTFTDEAGHQWQWVMGIERLTTPSALWKYAGLVPGMKREKGQPLPFNGTLKTMAYRTIHFGCILTGNRYADAYRRYKERIATREAANGTEMRGTPRARWCEQCEKSITAKAAKYCPDCGQPLTQKTEPEGTLYKGHLDAMARRYTSKLLLSHLWLIWRTALGLPVRAPYPVEYLGHTTVVDPWEMCDLPE